MRTLFREFLILCGLVALGVSYSLWSGMADAPWSPAEIAAGEIRQVDARALDAFWIDARSDEDYAAAHLPEALSLNPENWDLQIMNVIGAWLEQPRPIIVYCQPGECGTSREIADRLRENLADAEIYTLLEGWSPAKGGAE